MIERNSKIFFVFNVENLTKALPKNDPKIDVKEIKTQAYMLA